MDQEATRVEVEVQVLQEVADEADAAAEGDLRHRISPASVSTMLI